MTVQPASGRLPGATGWAVEVEVEVVMGGTGAIAAEARQRVLLVEDEPGAAHAVASFLRGNLGWAVDIARDGHEALRMFRSAAYTLVLIDWMLPGGLDGLEVCRGIRAVSKAVAAVFLTGREAREDQLRALHAGADDYLVKPFDPELLAARAKAVVRRSSVRPASARSKGEPTLTADDQWLDRDTGVAQGPRGHVQLTRLELRVLVLCESSGTIPMTSEAIAAAALGREDHAAKNLVHRHIANIRSKLERVGIENSIVRGPLGYVLRKR